MENIRIAINYFGMTRSIRFVYESHYKYIFDIFKQNNIEYDVYIHSWETDKNIIWDYALHIPIDYEEYKLLNPTEYKLDNQDDFLKTIVFDNYFNNELYEKFGGMTQFEWYPHLIKNHLCALESKKRVTDMCLKSNKPYDYVLYIRPDVLIKSVFPIEVLNNLKQNNIAIPIYDNNEGYNDRCAIVPFQNCEKYGKRIIEIIEFKKTHGRIVSEKFVKYIVDKYYDNVFFFDFKFKIIRPQDILDPGYIAPTIHK